ncbi:hypothetical protein ACTMU2_41765 [Cupriavidus basilensis]
MTLLTPEEDIGLTRRFDIALLCDRLSAATESIERLAGRRDLRLGYFSASTGAAAAVRAAAAPAAHRRIDAVVSRGGRVDLAGHDALCRLASPLLMIVGEADPAVVNLNARGGVDILRKRLEVVPGATHLFEELGALEHVRQACGRMVRAPFRRSRRERIHVAPLLHVEVPLQLSPYRCRIIHSRYGTTRQDSTDKQKAMMKDKGDLSCPI